MPKALSLKYRPKTFSDLVGQDSISQTLSLALELDKVSHAYLFSGLRGSGKTSSARIFARALQCEKFPTATACNECASCDAVNNSSHIDIIEMDAASSRGIDDIKGLIEQIAYPPSFGRFKIFIIDEIHMLTKEAFNAFLKTLEEPPNYVKFILATTDPLKLPVTILSRTQHFRFKKIPTNAIEAHLKKVLALENVAFEDEALKLLSRNCGGSLRDAMTMLEQAIIFSNNNLTLKSLSTMLGALNPQKIGEFFDALLVKNDDATLDRLLNEFESYEAENVLNEMIEFLKAQMIARESGYPLLMLERFFRILGEAKNMLSINADASFALLLALLKMKEARKINEIDRVIAKLEKEINFEVDSADSQNLGEKYCKTPQIMGIINITNDSFYAESRTQNIDEILQKIEAMIAQGVGIIDIGAASTRPDSTQVPAEVELARLKEPLQAIFDAGLTKKAIFSLDSYNFECVKFALTKGFHIINDVYGLRDIRLAELAKNSDKKIVLMHNSWLFPHSKDIVRSVDEFFTQRLEMLEKIGIKSEQVILDVGFGFGKNSAENLRLTQNLRHFKHFGCAILMGASMKRTIGEVVGKDTDARLFGTLALHQIALDNGADIIRCHDFSAHIDMLKMWLALNERF